jgi:hypothetical protein
MEVRGAGRGLRRMGPLNFANMVEFAIDQGLAEICCGFAGGS